ncbi:hypothetical protein [Candidatus Entotheonella palauensis]|uniref:Uncharacterized protein n=1 Tax=Candidatus Entotheonella gemina TaxID=1429439 RepID=W4M4U5_9BACT|nr:hypothetical protein [Candidatus Entotheonella palauensis]ETX05349.1 MAG: hypothetical protein ETSY2_23480 [Candidatus Entotheonella gemina]
MRTASDPLPLGVRLLHDVSTIAVIALIAVPGYLLLNHFWRSIILLLAFYGLLSFAFLRLGRHVRRVMRHLPAEIPPWRAMSAPLRPPRSGVQDTYTSSEVLRHVRKDPHYVQDVLKPRLRQLVTYRLNGSLDCPFEDLDHSQLERVDAELLNFLSRQEPTGLWATYRYRSQRLRDVLTALQYVEAL